MKITEINGNVRLKRALRRMMADGLFTAYLEFLTYKNFGEKTLNELRAILAKIDDATRLCLIPDPASDRCSPEEAVADMKRGMRSLAAVLSNIAREIEGMANK